ncbi:MAG: RHS repeat-associated core domain-containing protein [Nocardioides sp.]|uniref:RHS repeat domain-containing protein n=1 Tax=Nocardioides sp. TaxID=35761 RepID=UPI003D6A9601
MASRGRGVRLGLRLGVALSLAVTLLAGMLTSSVPITVPLLRVVDGVVCGDEAGQSQRATTFDAPCLAPEATGEVTDASPGEVEVPVEEEDTVPDPVPVETAAAEKSTVGTATVSPTEKLTQADDLPVWVEADDGDAGKAPNVEVEVVGDDPADAARGRAGASGPVVRVTPEEVAGAGASSSAAPPEVAPVKVAMDVSAYSRASTPVGGGWESRLRLVAYPACVLTTPKNKSCQVSTWLDTTRDSKGRLSATLPGDLLSKPAPNVAPPEQSKNPGKTPEAETNQPGETESETADPEATESGTAESAPAEPEASESAASKVEDGSNEPEAAEESPEAKSAEAAAEPAAAGVVLMAETTPTGADGDWTATSLGTAASWSGGGSSGSFTWSYPLQTPPVASGMEPGLGLTYDSGSVDGVIGSGNVQASWAGLGWDLAPGFIERSYAPCAEDQADDPGAANNKDRDTGDLCWRGEALNLSLSAHAGELVKDPSGGAGDFRLRTDDGSVITRLGVKGGQFERFQVTTPDGTRYLFGQTDADTGANSSLRVPVYGNHAGEPGHAATFGSSSQDAAWRWNLTEVTDPVGNTVTYHWAKETNRYRANENIGAVPDEDRGGVATGYDRGGYLTKVTYGTKSGSTGAAPARVLFDVSERCRNSYNCSTGSGNTLNANNANQWPDVPFDMVCTSGDCDLDTQFSPTFFTTKQLTRVRTQTYTGNGPDDGFEPVDEWTLGYVFPKKQDPRDQVTLWLSSITHRAGAATPGSGTLAGKAIFRSTPMKNRVDTSTDNLPPMYRPRITSIIDELGSVLGVAYSPPACKVDGAFPAPSNNTQRCFPDEAHYDTFPEENHWFYKYVVTAVTQDPGIGFQVRTTYGYGDSETSAGDSDGAWARSDDPLALDRKKRWNQWRGYAKVTTRVGEAGADGTGHPRTKTVATFDRGMGSDGTGLDPEARARAGVPTSTTTYAGESVVSKQTTSYDVIPAAAGHTADRDPRRVQTASTLTASPRASADGGGGQYVKVTMDYDSRGREVERDDHAYTKTSDAAAADTTDRTCLYTTYPGSVVGGLTSYPSQSRKAEGACGAEPPAAAGLLEGTQWAYDGGSVGQAPTKGLVTTTKAVVDDAWQTTAATTYDANGRVKTVTDAAGAATSIAYTPEAGRTPTKVVSTSPDPDGAGPLARHQTTTVNEPKWGLPTTVTDPAGGTTTADYDSLGRLVSVKLPGNNSGVADLAYTYQLRGAGGAKTNAITTKTLTGGTAGSAPGQVTSTALFDSLGRQVQSQAETRWTDEKNKVAKGRVVSITNYDTAGRVAQVDNQVLAAGLPTTTFVDPVDAAPESVLTTYDGASRPMTQTTNWVGTDADPVTRYSYDGNLTHTNPPDGGVATTVVADARGRSSEQWKHTDGGANSDAGDGTKVVTSYGYTATGLLETVKDEKDNTWTYTYDELGHRLSTSDPDAGDSSTTYDDLGRPVESVDANGTKLRTSYDAMGRQTALEEVAGDGTREKVAGWVYDTIQTGQLTSTTRYRDGAALYTQAIDAYNPAGQPTDSHVTLAATAGLVPGEVAGTYRTKQSYRLDGQVAATSYYPITPTGATTPVLPAEKVVHDYDDLGRPIRMGGSMGQYVIATAYSAYSQLDQLALGNTYGHMSWQSYRYQPGSGRLSEQQVDRQTRPELDQLQTYAYNLAGNVTSVQTDKQATGAADPSWQETECYQYDGLNRLKTAWSGTAQTCGETAPAAGDLPSGHGFAQAWTFEDATNNRLTDTYTTAEGTTRATYSYPADGPAHAPGTVAVDTVSGTADAALTGIEGTYTYSDAGELLGRPVKGDMQRLEWDPEHHLAGVDPASETAAAQTAVYDTAGARVLRRVTDPGASTVTTVYLPGGVELVHDSAKDTGAGLQAGEVAPRRDYTFAGQLIATRTGLNPADVTTWSVDAQGTPEYALGNAETAAASAEDESVPQRRQRPFGADRGTHPDKAAFPGEKGFVGSTRDEGVDLLQVGARPYDPVLGLFVTTDPIVDLSDPASLNAYSYANQNPVTFSDPTGLYAIGDDRKPDHGTNRAITRARLTAPPPPPDPITVISSFPGEEFYAQPGVSGDEIDEMVAEELELSSPIDVALTRIAWACDRGDDDFKDQHCAKASMDCDGWACGSNQGAKDAFILFVGDPSACKDLGAACIFEVAAAIPALKILKAKEAAMASRAATNAGAKLGWKAGDDIYALTKAGNKPAWSTVRGRFWKNEAASSQIDSWSEANIARMRRGLAPQRYNRDKGGMESMELSHEPIPYRDGGTEVVPRWPQEHAAVDPYRHPGY